MGSNSVRLILLSCLIALPFVGQAQSLRKEEKRAINRTHLRVVSADTVQHFDVSLRARKYPHRKHMYYWFAAGGVHHAQGEFNGRLLHGPYRVTTREEQPLSKGRFRHGVKTGRWQQWHANGQLAQETRWRRGHLSGRPMAYDQQGHVITGVPAAATPVKGKPGRIKRLFARQAKAPKHTPPPATADGQPVTKGKQPEQTKQWWRLRPPRRKPAPAPSNPNPAPAPTSNPAP